jgi:serine/threonine protein kinase/Tfp pilus assembly protein PilF
MELLEGNTLRECIQNRALSIDQIIDIAVQIADALKMAHAKEILHSDIKPENIFISSRGQAKIADFGLAKLVSGSHVSQTLRQTKAAPQVRSIAAEYISAPHVTIGALPNMSPEQALGEEIDARSDLFSFGSMLYEMATGFPPFEGKTQPVLFQEILTKIPVSPMRINPEIPTSLNELICKLHEKDRDLRPQTAADVCADLKRAKRDRELKHDALASSREEERKQSLFSRPGADLPLNESSFLPARWKRVFRRPKSLLLYGAIFALLLALAASIYLNRSSYIPYIAFYSFSGGSQSVDAQIVGFALKRTLSQFQEVVVLNGQEFNNLLTIEKARKESTRAKAPAAAWWQRITLPSKEAHEPAVRVYGQVNDSLGRLEIKLDCIVRGRQESISMNFRGVDDLLNGGIDSLVQRVLYLYDTQISERHIQGGQPRYRTAVQLLSSRWDALRHYYRGSRAWQRRDLYSAERELRSALEVDPKLALAHLMLGEIRVWQNQWDAAQTDILAARARAQALLDVDLLRVEALLARAFSEPFKERDYLHRLIGLQPYRGEYLYELAESYFHTADVDEAITHYLDVLRLDRSYALSFNHLAYSYAWRGDHARALEACKRYLALHRSANAYDSLGEIYMLAGDYANAEQMKSKAIKMDPQIYYASRNLAFIEMMRGRNKMAGDRLKELFDATGSRLQRTQLYAALAFLRYRKGDLEAARDLCEEGMKLLGSARYDAPHDELLWIEGMAELQRRNLPAARQALGQLRHMLDLNSINAMNYKPAYKYYLHLLAWILAEEGRYEEAEGAINDLKWVRYKLGYWNKPYEQAFFYDEIGQIYEKMKKLVEAEQAYRGSLNYNPHFAFSRVHLARLLHSRNSLLEAKRELDAFWQEWQGADPDAIETIEARRLADSLQQIK